MNIKILKGMSSYFLSTLPEMGKQAGGRVDKRYGASRQRMRARKKMMNKICSSSFSRRCLADSNRRRRFCRP